MEFIPERWKKANGETFHQEGQKVWLVGDTVTVKPRRRKSFGVVVKDSVFPNLWVTVRPWNKEQWSRYWNAFNEKKRLEGFRRNRDRILRKQEKERKKNVSQATKD